MSNVEYILHSILELQRLCFCKKNIFFFFFFEIFIYYHDDFYKILSVKNNDISIKCLYVKNLERNNKK